MQRKISDKLRSTIQLWRSPGTEGEAAAAREAIIRLCERERIEPLDALKEFHLENAGDKPFGLAGHAEIMADKEEFEKPGTKAAEAREKAEKIAARFARKQALLERYGSFEAAIAPCERERLLLAAVSSWRITRDPPWDRWTDSLDGWHDDFKEPPQHIGDAIREAYPWPQTLPDVFPELDYWRSRDRDLNDLFNEDCQDILLDLVARIRLRMLERLAESELPARNASEILTRLRYFETRDRQWYEYEEWAERLIADVEILAAKEADDAKVSTCVHDGAAPTHTYIRPPTNGQIGDLLLADPSRSDRSIARELNVSPTTVGKVRATLGLKTCPRSVQRGGKSYSFQKRVALQ
jgi:hypothetical protein